MGRGYKENRFGNRGVPLREGLGPRGMESTLLPRSSQMPSHWLPWVTIIVAVVVAGSAAITVAAALAGPATTAVVSAAQAMLYRPTSCDVT